jgi:hypothetical protein
VLRSDLEVVAVEIKDLKHKLDHSPFLAKHVTLSRVNFSMLPKRTLSFSRRSLIWLHVLRKLFWARKWSRRIW